ACLRRLLAPFGHVHNGQQDTVRREAFFGRLEQPAVEVVAHGDEVPGAVLDRKIAPLLIGDARVDLEVALRGPTPQDDDGLIRTVDSRYPPAVCRQPQGVAAGTAGEIECAAGLQPL